MADETNKIIDITPNDLYLTMQQIQRRYVKLVVFNRQWMPVGEIKGQVISGNITIDAANNIRRTASLELYVANESMEDAANFVMQNYLQLWCGIQDNRDYTVTWYNYGIFIINNHSYKFDAKTRTVSLSIADLMSDLNGDRGGALHAYNAIAKNSERIDTVIKNVLTICGFASFDIIPIGAKSEIDISGDVDVDTGLSQSIEQLRSLGYTEKQIEILLTIDSYKNDEELIAVMQAAGFDESFITSIIINVKHSQTTSPTPVDEAYLIPYDLNFSVGVTGYEIIEKLVSLYPYYRMRFNVDGVFIVDKVILEYDESHALISADTLDKLIVSEEKAIDWTKIKNHIEVWGKDGLYYGEAEDNVTGSPFNVQSIGVLRSVYSGDIYDNIYDRYKNPEDVEDALEKQAKLETKIAKLKSMKVTSAEEKADINKKIKEEKTQLAQAKSFISSNVYIKGNDMAKDYADKLLYENCRINDSLNLTTIFMPFLNEVDFKIQHRTSLDNSVHTYILKSVSHDLKAGTSTLNCVRFYDSIQQSELVQLDAPTVVDYTVDRMTITIVVNPVEHATKYLLYADFNVVEISNDTTFVYTMIDRKAGLHDFYVTAASTAYRESDYDQVIRVELSYGEDITDENGESIINENNENIIV